MITILILILIIYITVSTYLIYYLSVNSNSIKENFEQKQYNLERDIKLQDSKKVRSIEEKIEVKYRTFQIEIQTEDNNNYDYNIIQTFKEILKRQPNSYELIYYRNKLLTGEITVPFLYMILYNDSEYESSMLVQLNSIDRGLENAIFKKKMYEFIKKLYERYIKKKLNEELLPYLKDIYNHLYFDTYLFIAFLTMKNYKTFENDLLSQPIVNKYILRELFEKYTDLDKMTQIANELKENDLKDGKSNILNETFDMKEIRAKLNLEESEKDMEDISNKIIDYVNNKDKSKEIIEEKEEKCKKTCNSCRYYDPLKSARGVNECKAPICTSLNQKQLTQPIFTNDSMNFQGTNIEEDTSIGTIMPKFIFHEYINKDEEQMCKKDK
jgi:hypothetical protein